MLHRKQIKHFHEPGHLHELTFSCYKRRPLLDNDRYREVLARSLDAAGHIEGINLVAFVFMPEHVHLLVYPVVQEPAIGRYLARIKQPASKQIKGLLTEGNSPLLDDLIVRERPGKFCFRFWQEGPGFDRNFFSSHAIRSSMEYIHRNPVRRKLCESAVDWTWSSARYYLGDSPSEQQNGLPFIHGLPHLALD